MTDGVDPVGLDVVVADIDASTQYAYLSVCQFRLLLSLLKVSFRHTRARDSHNLRRLNSRVSEP